MSTSLESRRRVATSPEPIQNYQGDVSSLWGSHKNTVTVDINYYGKPVLRMDQSFRRVVADAGLKDVTPHTLRHTSATWMAQAGVPLWVIAKYLGHSSSRTTEKIYAHHNPSFLLEAKQALERRLEPNRQIKPANFSKPTL
jgi:integrase